MSIQTDDFAAPSRRMVAAAPASPNEEAVERALRPKLLDGRVLLHMLVFTAACDAV